MNKAWAVIQKRVTMPIRSKLPKNLGAHAWLVFLTALFVALIAGVGIGIRFRLSAYKNTEAAGSFVDGLVANGLSVIISTLFIVPLTTIVTAIIRERREVPVRKSFVDSIASEMDRFAQFYISHLAMFSMGLQTLGLALQIEQAKISQETMISYMQTVKDKLNHSIDEGSVEGRPTSPLLSKAIESSKSLSLTVKNLYDYLYRESSTLENTLGFAAPLFRMNEVAKLHRIREIVIEVRTRQQDMLAVLSGVSNPATLLRARESTFDFWIVRILMEQIGESVGIKDMDVTMPNVKTLLDMDKQRPLRRFTESVVDMFGDSREADALWEKFS